MSCARSATIPGRSRPTADRMNQRFTALDSLSLPEEPEREEPEREEPARTEPLLRMPVPGVGVAPL
jgi:hypothetical protein